MAKYNNVNEYIEANWVNVLRECRQDKGKLVGIPYKFTVPSAGHFESLYYWDTYFTNVGLLLCGREMLAKQNADNIMYLIEKSGFMPNSNGIYHLDHSQPPFLSIMVRELYEHFGDKVWLIGAYEMLCREYNYWMTERSTPIGLNRYDTNETDRAYLATRAPDYEGRICLEVEGDRADIGRHYLGTCECGYDCSSRFDHDIYNYAPVCLNALLYALEDNMVYFANVLGKGEDEAAKWAERAEKRKALMKKYMLDGKGLYMDYNFVTGKQSTDFSCAAAYPLTVGMADEADAKAFAENLYRMEAEYGVTSSEKNDKAGNYQWGYPNGWSPLQIMIIRGLDKYGYKDDAMRIAKKCVALYDKVLEETGELWEKYNVVDGNIDVVQESSKHMPAMIGWTAGAYLYSQSYIAGK